MTGGAGTLSQVEMHVLRGHTSNHSCSDNAATAQQDPTICKGKLPTIWALLAPWWPEGCRGRVVGSFYVPVSMCSINVLFLLFDI